MKTKQRDKFAGFEKFSDRELAEALVFPSPEPVTVEDKQAEEDFWKERRKTFENRTPQQKMFTKLLQLKFQMEEYVGSNHYKEALSFGYFLNEYVSRQEKQDKEFAVEVDVKPAVLSQYLNNHRKPTEKFVIRLELHSNGMIPALTWFKLLQKEKEYELRTNENARLEENKHVTNKLKFAY